MKRLFAALILSCAIFPAHAGRACETRPASAATFVSAMQVAEKTRAALEASGAQVALLARVGQDLSSYGLRYSHLAFAWRDHPQGRWLVVHELNRCGTDASALFNEGLANFFLDDLFAFEAKIVVPSPESQARIAQALSSPVASRMHSPRYNMLAFPFSTMYQNSNQWVLETYAASSDPLAAASRTAAQGWLKLAGYQPKAIRVWTGKRLGARMFTVNISFDDHPLGRRMAGQIDTVTVESVLDFVKRRDPQAREILVR
ncbi:DUF2145 domain-containing protein [Massilia sp. PAMC28688]|uniref:DUF2145 domain-containing protein n=1 Tax=Massilia sp. PAMC28688 TaxID=2861283 RepID=UPI001C632F7E|nr:DUF2145 domain-containing protein [Massilia sp. PAMC28688]QYF92220.1 DUF2145 domain-containing protein [Massilia sp. PAMC28688]